MTTKKTTDIYFASALSALGATLKDVDRADPRHMVFEFAPRTLSGDLPPAPSQNLDYIEREWANGILVVNAVQYAEALKRMKSIVHSK